MKKIVLILLGCLLCVSLVGCNESDMPLVDESTIPVGSFSGEIIMSGESGENSKLEEVTIELAMVDFYAYEENDEFAKLYGTGIEKYQISGLKDTSKQKVINDKLSNMYAETVTEYKKHISTEYLPSLNGMIIIENEDLLSFCISRKWLTNHENHMNEYFTINKKTREIVELSDFYGNRIGFLTEISKQIHDEFEVRKEKFKNDYEIDDTYFFSLTEEDFYDKILLNQDSFYVSESGELIYYFPKYEIGPGVIGDQEFILLENVEIK